MAIGNRAETDETSADVWSGVVRHDWNRAQAQTVHDAPFLTLLFEAQRIHRRSFTPGEVQKSALISIKTGGCPEDCGYCNQSAQHATGLVASRLIAVEEVVSQARMAKAGGATRYCMGAAWRSPKERDMETLCAMIREVRKLGLETCMTVGMLTDENARQLGDAGLDYYNHNVDTSEAYYDKVTSTRTYGDRLETLARVREAGIKVCCGGILGMGEQAADRLDMLVTLANLDVQPESVPINMLVGVPGTPLGDAPPVDPIDFVRAIATARVMMPTSMVRLSAGRTNMSDETQALCFLAGANSIFAGDRLLTTDNPGESVDNRLFARLGLKDMTAHSVRDDA